ncbi:MAG: hypothetical protein HY272_01905 [Gammaproteobacteria bacterium]|nr:hypothetical protein [Gammaproteobacteria bacterium]
MNDEQGEYLSWWRVIELLWPLNDMFRARLMDIRKLEYDEAFEEEADSAIAAYVKAPGAGAWSGISAGAWRVLLERHQQRLELAMHNEIEGVRPLTAPAGLNEADQLIFLMLVWLGRMKLPFPAADRSLLELSAGRPSPSVKGH